MSVSNTPQSFCLTVILLWKLTAVYHTGGRVSKIAGSPIRELVSVAFVRETMNGLHAVGQGLKKCLSPPARSIGGGLLIRLFVGFCEETHIEVVRRRILTHRDPEFNCPLALALVDRVEMQLRQLVRRL